MAHESRDGRPRIVKVQLESMPVCCWLGVREREQSTQDRLDDAIVCRVCGRRIAKAAGLWMIVS